MEIKNPFHEGQKVICISEYFPVIKEYSGDVEGSKNKPKKGEILIIDEILGEFLMFEKYNDSEVINWWIYKNFAPFEGCNSFEEINEYNRATVQDVVAYTDYNDLQ